jgi:6-phosphogluconate dehydrogenase
MASELGIIGMGVMGTSLARNFASKGIKLSIFNRQHPPHEVDVAEKAKNKYSELTASEAFIDLEAFTKSLASPKNILLMVQAGDVVDQVIEEIMPFLDKGDLLIDAGNSHFEDTEKRIAALSKKGIGFLGMGVSGGEKGALKGPSIMPGGEGRFYRQVENWLHKAAAVNYKNEPCVQWVGKGGSGHFVKMVHNGIEYAEMQLLAEIYDLLRHAGGMKEEDLAGLFEEWNKGPAAGYLLEITANILKVKEGEEYLLDKILDVSGSKGTGTWTVLEAVKLGVPIPTIYAALYARNMSGLKEVRTWFSKRNNSRRLVFDIQPDTMLKAYQAARLINHHQGFELMKTASDKYDWGLDLKSLASIWTNGCIIRSRLMQMLAENPIHSTGILGTDFFNDILNEGIQALNDIVSLAVKKGWAVPCLSASADYYASLHRADSPANLIQAQRDYFGAHTYQRTDHPEGTTFHTDWENQIA